MSTTDLPLAEITIRKFERPENIDKKTLIRRFCISLGLINPGDNRTGIVEVFQTVFDSKESLDAEQVFELLERKLALSGIRRHLRRLEERKLLDHKKTKYSIAEGGNLVYSIKYALKEHVIDDIFNRLLEYAEALQNKLKTS